MMLVSFMQEEMKVHFLVTHYRTKTIVECANVRIDEKFGTKEKLMD